MDDYAEYDGVGLADLVRRREDLLDADPDRAFRTRLDAINAPLEASLQRLTRALRGRADARSREATLRAARLAGSLVLRRSHASRPRRPVTGRSPATLPLAGAPGCCRPRPPACIRFQG